MLNNFNQIRLVSIIFFIAFFCSLSTVYSSGTKERTDEKKFSVSGSGKLILKSNVGDVDIIAGKNDEVSVLVKVKGTEKKVDKFKTDFKQEGNTITVEGDFEKTIVDKFKFGLFRSSSLDVKFIVSLPEQFFTDITTAGGEIKIKGMKNKQVGKTSGGEVTVENCNAELWLATSGGDMEVRNSNGNANLRTSGGDIRIKNSPGDLELKTSGGDIELDEVEGKIVGETSGGKIEVRAKDNKGMDLKTSGGDITVKLPQSAKGVLDASTFGGEVHCDLPHETVGKVKKTKMKANINGGGELMLLKTSGGKIKVESF
jgi:DUF4097 and DUF4098 domain-containing protein YvlB